MTVRHYTVRHEARVGVPGSAAAMAVELQPRQISGKRVHDCKIQAGRPLKIEQVMAKSSVIFLY